MPSFPDIARLPCTAADVRACYRLFLRREPESEAVAAAREDLSMLGLAREFAGSTEFAASLLLPAAAGRLEVDRLLAPAPDDLREWAEGLFGAPAGGPGSSIAAVLGHALATLAAGGGLDRPPQPFLYAARVLSRLRDGDPATTPFREALAARFVATRDVVEADAHGAALAVLDAAAGVDTGGGVADAPLRDTLRKAFAGGAWSELIADGVLVARSGLFDPAWYAARHPHVAASGMASLFHYLVEGAAAGLAPSALFSPDHYRERAGAALPDGTNPLVHYLREGWAAGLSPNPAFDADWYRRRHLADAPGVEPLGHYLRHGAARRLRPHPLFDRDAYLERYPDLPGSGLDPFEHWMRHGRAEGRVANDPDALGRSLAVAVVAHVAHPELWAETAARLRAVPPGFDLYATVPAGSPVAARIAEDWPGARVWDDAERVDEAAALRRALPAILERGHDVMLVVHTRREAVEPATWRFLLLEGLLGHAPFVRQLLGWFEHDPDLVMAGPGALHVAGDADPALEAAWQRLSDVPLPERWGYIAGGMAWVRPALLRPLLALDEVQPTVAERLVGALAAASGGRIALSDVSGPRVGPTPDVAPAPHRLILEPLADTLSARARALASRMPALRKPTRRAWVAPRDVLPGVTFVGPVEAVSGLGVSARGFVDALTAAGCPLHVMPWRPGFDRVQLRAFDAPAAGEQAINLVHLNLDLLHSARLLDQAPLDRLLSPDRYNVAIVSWELSALDPRWTETIHRFDEVWASSSFMARAIAAVSAMPVRVVRPALAGDSEVAREPLPVSLPDDRTLFFYAADFGSVVRRKNPEAFWRAYVEEFRPDDGAMCLLKLHYPDPANPLVQEVAVLAAERPDVMLLTETLSDGAMAALFDRIDCYVSPHRAEGLGLTMLEAMRAAKPVIATGFSGEADFVRADTAFLLQHGLVEVGAGAEPYPAGAVWADPEPASLRARMREVVAHPEAARERGRRGRARFEALFSRAVAGAAMRAELDRIWRLGGGRSRN